MKKTTNKKGKKEKVSLFLKARTLCFKLQLLLVDLLKGLYSALLILTNVGNTNLLAKLWVKQE
jgi:hypothetical protein